MLNFTRPLFNRLLGDRISRVLLQHFQNYAFFQDICENMNLLILLKINLSDVLTHFTAVVSLILTHTSFLLSTFPLGNYLLKVNKRINRTRCEIFSKLTIKSRMTPMVTFWCLYCYLWTYFTLVLVFLLTLSR